MSSEEDGLLENLIQLHGPALERFAARQLGEHSRLAEDVVQEALLSAHRAIAAGTRPAHPKAWLFAIVRNAAIDAARASRPAGAIEEHRHGTADEVVPATVEQGEWIDWLMSAIGELPDRQREALVGHTIEGRSYREIAARQQTTVSAVKSLIGRARRALSADAFPGAGLPPAICSRALRSLLSRGPLAGKAGAKGIAGALAQAAVAATVTTGVLFAVHGGSVGSVLASPGPARLPDAHERLSRAQTQSRHRETKHAREARIHREAHHAIAACVHGRPLRGRYGEAALKFAVKHLSSDVTEYTECEAVLRHAQLHRRSSARGRRRRRPHPSRRLAPA